MLGGGGVNATRRPTATEITRARRQAPAEFVEGTALAIVGGDGHECPYDPSSVKGRAWLTGYRSRQAELEAEWFERVAR